MVLAGSLFLWHSSALGCCAQKNIGKAMGALVSKNGESGENRESSARTDEVRLRMTAIDGKSIDIEKLRGKVVLLQLWNVHCGACITALPKIRDLHEKFANYGLIVVGVCSIFSGDTSERILGFIDKHNMSWMHGMLRVEELQSVLRDLAPVPAAGGLYYIIGRDGKMIAMETGSDALYRSLSKVFETDVRGEASSP